MSESFEDFWGKDLSDSDKEDDAKKEASPNQDESVDGMKDNSQETSLHDTGDSARKSVDNLDSILGEDSYLSDPKKDSRDLASPFDKELFSSETHPFSNETQKGGDSQQDTPNRDATPSLNESAIPSESELQITEESPELESLKRSPFDNDLFDRESIEAGKIRDDRVESGENLGKRFPSPFAASVPLESPFGDGKKDIDNTNGEHKKDHGSSGEDSNESQGGNKGETPQQEGSLASPIFGKVGEGSGHNPMIASPIFEGDRPAAPKEMKSKITFRREDKEEEEEKQEPDSIQGSTTVKKTLGFLVVLAIILPIFIITTMMNVGNNDRRGVCGNGSALTADGISASGGTRGVPAGEFSWPMGKDAILTSKFMDPSRGVHKGIDLSSGKANAPLYAMYDGVVTTVHRTDTPPYTGYGTMVIISHEKDGKQWDAWYAHQYPKDLMVREGQQVKAGQQIGVQGSFGQSTGNHLHFEIHPDSGAAVDPLPWLENAKYPDDFANGGTSVNAASQSGVVTVTPIQQSVSATGSLYNGSKYTPHVSPGGAVKVVKGMGVKPVQEGGATRWVSTQERQQEVTDVNGTPVNGYEGSTDAAKKLVEILIEEFGDEPGAAWMSAWRPGSGSGGGGDISPDHPDGRAVDFGVAMDEDGLKLGDKVNQFIIDNAEKLGVAHTVWASDKGVDWRWEHKDSEKYPGFALPSSYGHRDHVHISMTGAPISDNWRESDGNNSQIAVCCADSQDELLSRNGESVDVNNAVEKNRHIIYTTAEVLKFATDEDKNQTRILASMLAASTTGMTNTANDGSNNSGVSSGALAGSFGSGDTDNVGANGDRVGLFALTPIQIQGNGQTITHSPRDLSDSYYSSALIMSRLAQDKGLRDRGMNDPAALFKELGYPEDKAPSREQWNKIRAVAEGANKEITDSDSENNLYSGNIGVSESKYESIKRASLIGVHDYDRNASRIVKQISERVSVSQTSLRTVSVVAQQESDSQETSSSRTSSPSSSQTLVNCETASPSGKSSGELNSGEIPPEYVDLIIEAAGQTENITPPMLAAILYIESRFNPTASSGVAHGIAQFTPATWATWGNGGNINNPKDAIPASARYLDHLYKHAKSVAENIPGHDPYDELMAAAYNGGPGSIQAGACGTPGKVPACGNPNSFSSYAAQTYPYAKVKYPEARDKFSK